MASILEAQKALGENFDVGGIERQPELQLNAVEKVMKEAAERFIVLAKRRINAKKKVDRGNLGDISISSIQKTGNKYSLTIGYDKSNPASEYYDFQNKGVKGIKSNQPNSLYKFRTLSVSKNMVEAILQWYLRHKNYIKNDDQKFKLTRVQKKQKSIASLASSTKNLRQLAINTAKNIKKKGIARVGFFDDNLDKAFGQEFQAKLAQALGQDIALTITQTFKK